MYSGTPTHVDVGGKKPFKRKRARYITSDTSLLGTYALKCACMRACAACTRILCISMRVRTCVCVCACVRARARVCVCQREEGFVALFPSRTPFYASLNFPTRETTTNEPSSPPRVSPTTFFFLLLLLLLFRPLFVPLLILTTLDEQRQQQQRPAAACVSSAPGHYHRPVGSVDWHEVSTSARLRQRQQHQRRQQRSQQQHRRCW